MNLENDSTLLGERYTVGFKLLDLGLKLMHITSD